MPKILLFFQMKELYDWHDVAKRTEIVYDRALKCPNQNLLDRLSRYAVESFHLVNDFHTCYDDYVFNPCLRTCNWKISDLYFEKEKNISYFRAILLVSKILLLLLNNSP